VIIGIGSDIVDIRRIEKSLKQFGAKFETRVFTPLERKKVASRKKSGAKIIAGAYAKRFAAKEACVKALGILENGGLSWQDIEITNLPSGAPTITLYGGALKKLKSLTPSKTQASIHVSLSDDYPFAQAFVIISAEPK